MEAAEPLPTTSTLTGTVRNSTEKIITPGKYGRNIEEVKDDASLPGTSTFNPRRLRIMAESCPPRVAFDSNERRRVTRTDRSKRMANKVNTDDQVAKLQTEVSETFEKIED